MDLPAVYPSFSLCLALPLALGSPCEWVFFREGAPIRSFKASWAVACIRAGLADASGEPNQTSSTIFAGRASAAACGRESGGCRDADLRYSL